MTTNEAIRAVHARRPRAFLAVGYGFTAEADSHEEATALLAQHHVASAPYASAVYRRDDRATGLFVCPECDHRWQRAYPMADDDISCPSCSYRDEARNFWAQLGIVVVGDAGSARATQ